MSAARRSASRSARGRQQLENTVIDDQLRTLRSDRLDADMVGAGVPVLLNPCADRAFVAPCDHRIQKSLRATSGQVLIPEALSPPAVDVVFQLHIARQRLACGAARRRGVGP